MALSTSDIFAGCAIVVTCGITVLIGFAVGTLIKLRKLSNKVNKILGVFGLSKKIAIPILLGKRTLALITEMRKNFQSKSSKRKGFSDKLSEIIKHAAWIGLGLFLYGIFRKKD